MLRAVIQGCRQSVKNVREFLEILTNAGELHLTPQQWKRLKLRSREERWSFRRLIFEFKKSVGVFRR